MSAQYNPLPTGYSDGLRYLLKILLKIHPSERPSASEVLQYWIPFIHRTLGKSDGYLYVYGSTSYATEELPGTAVESLTKNVKYLNQSTATLINAGPVERSVLYQLKAFGSDTTMSPIQLPVTAKIVSVSASENHFIAVLADGSVYTWGEGGKGQLGHDTLETWKHFPTKVEALSRYIVIG